MSQVYGGNASNILSTVSPALTITNVTNTANAVITVSGPLPGGFVSGVTVDIRDVQGATGVNGQWTATVVNAALGQFSIANATLPGLYVSSTGTAQPLYLAAVTIPSDGDAETAASVGVSLQGLSDMTAALAVATGGYKLKDIFVSQQDTTDFSNWATISSATADTWTDWGGSASTWMPFRGSSIGHGVPVNAGDIVRLTTTFSFSCPSALSSLDFLHALWSTIYVPGATPVYSRVPGASLEMLSRIAGGGTLQYVVPVTLIGLVTVGAGQTGYLDWKLRLLAHAGSVSGASVNLAGSFYAEAQIWRPTNLPQ